MNTIKTLRAARTFVTLCVLGLAIGCGSPGPTAAPRVGEVVERIYTPPVSGTGFGTGVCSGGGKVGTCTGTIFYSEGERWTLILRGDDGKVWAQSVSPEQWDAYPVGSRITVQ